MVSHPRKSRFWMERHGVNNWRMTAMGSRTPGKAHNSSASSWLNTTVPAADVPWSVGPESAKWKISDSARLRKCWQLAPITAEMKNSIWTKWKFHPMWSADHHKDKMELATAKCRWSLFCETKFRETNAWNSPTNRVIFSWREKSENGRERCRRRKKSNRIPNRWRGITQPGPHMRQIQSHGLYMGPK